MSRPPTRRRTLLWAAIATGTGGCSPPSDIPQASTPEVTPPNPAPSTGDPEIEVGTTWLGKACRVVGSNLDGPTEVWRARTLAIENGQLALDTPVLVGTLPDGPDAQLVVPWGGEDGWATWWLVDADGASGPHTRPVRDPEFVQPTDLFAAIDDGAYALPTGHYSDIPLNGFDEFGLWGEPGMLFAVEAGFDKDASVSFFSPELEATVTSGYEPIMLEQAATPGGLWRLRLHGASYENTLADLTLAIYPAHAGVSCVDEDGDGFGDPSRCLPEPGAATVPEPMAVDCDDGDAAIHPGATEQCDTPTDDDCDGATPDCAWHGDGRVSGSGGTFVDGLGAQDPFDVSAFLTHDATGDGVLDLVSSTPDLIRILAGPDLGGAPPTVASLTAYRAVTLGAGALADVDGDGALDIAVGIPDAHANGWVALWRPDLDGSVDVESLPITWNAAHATDVFGADYDVTGDLTGDGLPDLAVVALPSANPAPPLLLIGPGSAAPGGTLDDTIGVVGSYAADAFFGPNTRVDFNRDGVDDLVLQRDHGQNFAAFYGPITQTLYADDVDLAMYPGTTFAIIPAGDMDGDGAEDLGLVSETMTAYGMAAFLVDLDDVHENPYHWAARVEGTSESPVHFGAGLGQANGDDADDVLLSIPARNQLALVAGPVTSPQWVTEAVEFLTLGGADTTLMPWTATDGTTTVGIPTTGGVWLLPSTW